MKRRAMPAGSRLQADGQERDFSHVQRQGFRAAEFLRRRGLEVIVTLECQFLFLARGFALLPNRATGPRISVFTLFAK